MIFFKLKFFLFTYTKLQKMARKSTQRSRKRVAKRGSKRSAKGSSKRSSSKRSSRRVSAYKFPCPPNTFRNKKTGHCKKYSRNKYAKYSNATIDDTLYHGTTGDELKFRAKHQGNIWDAIKARGGPIGGKPWSFGRKPGNKSWKQRFSGLKAKSRKWF